MEIKKGLVQWNGRNDIPCTYGEIEDGTKYYFKQDLANGNYIYTTSLLEAVDPMTKAQNIGLIDGEGNILIPSVNSAIKVIDDVLLVEPAEAVSENVIEANKLRMDPLAATRLVATPAQIKDKINAKMSAEGRYIINDQFKEATIDDLSGNNLINGEYYSFIAKDSDKLFMAKNNLETDVVEFSITDKKVIEEVATTEEVATVEENVQEVAPVAEEVAKEEINLEGTAPVEENTQVEETVTPTENVNEGFAIEDVDLGQEFTAAEATQENAVEMSVSSGMFDDRTQVPVASGMFEDRAQAPVASGMFEDRAQVPVASGMFEDRAQAPVASGMFEDRTQAPVDEVTPSELSSVFGVTPAETDLGEEVSIPDEDANFSFEEITEETPEEVVSAEGEEVGYSDDSVRESELERRLNELNAKFESMNSSISKMENKEELVDEKPVEDIFTNSDFKVDSIEEIDEEDNAVFDDIEEPEEINDTTMEDATKAISDLLQKYTDKDKELNEALMREDKLKTSRKNYIEKAKAQEQKIEILNSKNHSLETTISKLESKNDSLEGKNHDQARIIDLQKREIEEQRREIGRLRSQVEGKEELARALESVRALIGDNDSYRDEDSYYKAA